MQLKKLKDCDLIVVKAMTNLDKKILAIHGDTFSEEVWEVDNFLYDLPGKFDNSFVLLNDEKEPVAYAINSIKNDVYFYTHRFVNTVHGGSKIIMDEILQLGEVFLLQVSNKNLKAISFYKKYGYQIVDDYGFIKELYPDSHEYFENHKNSSTIQKKYLMKLNRS